MNRRKRPQSPKPRRGKVTSRQHKSEPTFKAPTDLHRKPRNGRWEESE